MTDVWAETMNEFRSAVYTALEGGATIKELREDLDQVEQERGDDD